MKKRNLKLAILVCLLSGISTTASASYNGCRGAGGGFFECFVGAAMNDRIAPPQGGEGTTKPVPKHNEAQLKALFAKNNQYCSGVPVGEQVACLTKGAGYKKVNEVSKVVSKPAIKPVVKPVSKPVSKVATKEVSKTAVKAISK